MSQKVLVVIDMQNDFITGSLGTPEAQAVVKKVKAKIKQALKQKDTVLFTRDTHGADYMRTQEGEKLPVPHCIRYTSGWEIEQSLQVPSAQVFDKNTFGSLDAYDIVSGSIHAGRCVYRYLRGIQRFINQSIFARNYRAGGQ